MTTADTADTAQTKAPNTITLATAGVEPGDEFPVPADIAFNDADGRSTAFLDAPTLKAIAERLIAQNDSTFEHVGRLTIRYLWKKKGGTTDGKPVWGFAARPGPLLQHFVKTDFLVVLPADHLRAGKATWLQVEALIYHQLCHVRVNDEGRPAIAAHDFEGFTAEVGRYGLWQGSLRAMARAVQNQLEMFPIDLTEPEPDADKDDAEVSK